MRVAYDSRPATQHHGIGRYARCLLSALRDTASAGAEIVETHRPRRADLFHSPWMQGAMLRSPCPMVITVHDLTLFKRRSELLRMGARLRLRHLAVQRAVHVIVPSETVAAEAAAHLEIDRDRITIIPEAPDAAMYPRAEEEVARVRGRLGLPDRYLAWAASNRNPDLRKQLAGMAGASRELPLVLVGPARPWARGLGGAVATGDLSEDELAAVYSGAHALVCGSEEDGFGRPALEALACGTPVAAFDLPGLREVLGDRVSFVERGDLGALIEAAECSKRPIAEPPEWTWEDAGRSTWRVYEHALGVVSAQ